jgi:hypothetical protein
MGFAYMASDKKIIVFVCVDRLDLEHIKQEDDFISWFI